MWAEADGAVVQPHVCTGLDPMAHVGKNTVGHNVSCIVNLPLGSSSGVSQRAGCEASRWSAKCATSIRFGLVWLKTGRSPAPSPAAYHGRFRLTLARARALHQWWNRLVADEGTAVRLAGQTLKSRA